MSQFGSTLETAVDPDEIKTSGLAVGSLVSSLICCLPVTTILGVLLGIAAVFSINANPARKGKGLAAAGIILGILFTGVQIAMIPLGTKAYHFIVDYSEFVQSGPTAALEAGFNGDAAAFRSHFFGAGATVSDAEATRFIDEMRSRYGGFVSASLDPQKNQAQPGFGQTAIKMVYVVEFENQSTEADVGLVFADQTTGEFLKKLEVITIVDAEGGDLTYPPPSDTGP